MAYKPTETEVAAAALRWVGDHGAEVWQEVCCGTKRCDIVAKVGPVLIAIEAKTSLGAAVVEQAERWLRYAHRVYVTTPRSRRDGFWRRYLSLRGIGWLRVEPSGSVSEEVLAALRRRVGPKLQNALRDEHKTTLAAGSAGGGYWTPFAATHKAVVETVRRTPGLTVRALVSAIDHHYSSHRSARMCIARYVKTGVIEGIELRDRRLWPKSGS